MLGNTVAARKENRLEKGEKGDQVEAIVTFHERDGDDV